MMLKQNSFLFSMGNLRVKQFLAVLSLVFFCLVSVSELKAQLAVSMQLNRNSYILFEHIYAKVTFRNYSGRGLVFGKNKDLRGTVTFKIIAPNGEELKLNKSFDPSEPLEGTVLNPGATTSVILPISLMYNVRTAGQYSISAVVSHPMLSKSYVSDPKVSQNTFSVFNGIPVWKRIVGVPDVLNMNSKEKVKTRTVEILNFYDNNRKYYALMVEDKNYIYGVVRIAEDLEDELPQIQIDGLSRIHIFIQESAELYSYFVYDLNCKLEEQTNYKPAHNVAPVLVRDSDTGSVIVVGGEKAVEGKDFTKEASPNPVFVE